MSDKCYDCGIDMIIAPNGGDICPDCDNWVCCDCVFGSGHGHKCPDDERDYTGWEDEPEDDSYEDYEYLSEEALWRNEMRGKHER